MTKAADETAYALSKGPEVTTTQEKTSSESSDETRELSSQSGAAGDKIFSGAALTAGIVILVVLFAVAAFLVAQALPALVAPQDQIAGGKGFWQYILPLVIGTVIAAAVALVIA